MKNCVYLSEYFTLHGYLLLNFFLIIKLNVESENSSKIITNRENSEMQYMIYLRIISQPPHSVNNFITDGVGKTHNMIKPIIFVYR